MIVNQTFHLLSIPTSVIRDVLCSWLPIAEIGRLDSAFCQRDNRALFHATLAAKSFAFDWLIDMSEINFICWMIRKAIKIADVQFCDKLNYRTASEYLKLCGDAVRRAEFVGGGYRYQTNEMLLVALYCKNVKMLRVTDIQLEFSFGDLLWSNPNIHEISLKNATCAETIILEDTKLLNLCTLRVVNTKMS